MNDSTVIEEVEREFESFARPPIIYSIPKDSGFVDSERLMIQKDFECLDRDHMNYEQCSMMICDSVLVSDDAVFYFLPRLAKAVLVEGGDEGLFYRRLEVLDESRLSESQRQAISRLISRLKAIEQTNDRQL